MPKVKTEEKRERILLAALRVFSDKGYYGSSIPSIAKQAGVATGTIYVYFTDKRALVNELYTYLRNKTRQELDLGKPGMTPRERFHTLWQSYIHYGIRNREAVEFLEGHHHAPYLSKESRKAAFEWFNEYTGFLYEMLQAGAIKSESLYILLAAMEGMALGLLHVIWHGHVEPTDEAIAAMEQMAWEALRA